MEFGRERLNEIPPNVPRACGWRMLIRVTEPPERIGQIFTPTAWREGERALCMTAQIVQQGEDCYSDPNRFPNGRSWCRPGDWVLISKYAGTRFLVKGIEYRIINDDEPQAVFASGADVTELKRA